MYRQRIEVGVYIPKCIMPTAHLAEKNKKNQCSFGMQMWGPGGVSPVLLPLPTILGQAS